MTDLSEPDPIAADRRRDRRRRKLPPRAVCAVCGEVDIDVLEIQHALGRAASKDATVVLCRNCHARQTARQHDHKAVPPPGGDRGAPRSFPERLAAILSSIGVFLHALAHALIEYAAQLRVLVRQMDQAVTDWRGLPAAK